MPKIANRQIIEKAMENRHPLEFLYDGEKRTANPHHIGILGGELQIHAYQTGNGSKSGHIPGWKNFKVNLILQLTMLDTIFIPEDTFNPDSANYSVIYQQIKT